MENAEMPVTLIVKAPNQQIGDQTIQCQLNWTVKRLKTHLSEVYPSKPRAEDQKLIYSGHLLHDSSTLKEILRRYEGQEEGPSTHTLHLVCTASVPMQRVQPVTSTNSTSSARTPSPPVENLPRVPAVGEQVQDNSTDRQANNENSGNGSPNEGLRHRHPQVRTGAEMGVSVGGGVFVNPWAAWAMQATDGIEPPVGIASQQHWQMQWMQQAYAQYLAQYMQLIQSGAAPQGFFVPTPFGPGLSPDASGFNNGDTTPVGTPVFPPAANNNNEPVLQEGGVGGAEEVDGLVGDPLQGGQGQNRDWIDWIYYGSRLMVFLSIVYFYSTLARFLLVTGIGMAMYLWQVGFFRLQQPNPMPNQRRDREEEEVRNEGAELPNRVIPERETAEDETNEEANSQREAEQPQQRTAGPVTEGIERPTVFALTWTFFTSFFASLIPDTPNAI